MPAEEIGPDYLSAGALAAIPPAEFAALTAVAAAPGPAGHQVLGVLVEKQARGTWCWAAAAVSVERTYGGHDTQCRCVERVKGFADGVCCSFPATCDGGGSLDEIARALGPRYAGVVHRTVDPDLIESEIRAGRVLLLARAGLGHIEVCAGIEYPYGRRAVLLWDPELGGAKGAADCVGIQDDVSWVELVVLTRR